jgi:hypothetical protein
MYKQYFILLLLFLLLQIKTSAQFVASDTLVLQTKISINLSQASLYEILNEIEERYGINFSYANNLISLDAKKSINFKEQTLEKVLDEIFKRSTITYKVIGKRVVLIKEDLTNNLVTSASPIIHIDTNNFRLSSKSTSTQEIKKIPVVKGGARNRNNIKGFKKSGKKTSGDEFRTVLKIGKYKFKRTRDSTLTWDSLILLDAEARAKKHFQFRNISKEDRYSLAFNFIAGPSLKKLQSNNQEGKGIISQRGQENPSTGFNSEVIMNYNLTPRISFGQGIGLLVMGEKGSLYYQDTDFRRGHVCNDSVNYYDVYNYSNNFSYLTLPIVTGFSHHWKKFFVRFQGGLKPSFLMGKGKDLEYYNYAYYFDYENSSSWRQKNMEAPVKIAYRAFNLAYSFQAELGYKLGKISVSAGLAYNRFLLSTYKDSAPLKEKRYLPGIALSVRYHF